MNASSPLRLKYVATTITRGDAPSYVDEAGIPVVNQACVWPYGLALEKKKYHDPSSAKRVTAWIRAGDVLINSTGTGTLGRVAFVQDELEEPTFVDSHVTIIRGEKNKFNPKYLFYVLSTQQEQITVECSEGATNQIELSRYLLANKKIDWPELTIQQQIVSFLDKHTLRLDTLIAAKENLLKLVAEKRRALIITAVTRGIDPSVRLKESGIAWLGGVPEHWEITRAKNLFREIDQRSLTGEEMLLSLRMQLGLVPHNDVSEKAIPSEELIGYKIAKPNQIVINRMRAASGLVAIVPQLGIVSPDYAVFQHKTEVNPEYYTHLFRTTLLQAVFRSESKGLGTGSSGFLRLYSDNFLSISLPKPPIEEQSAIAKYIHAAAAKLDELKATTERTIALLCERRSALIADAVTGKIAVGDGA